MLSSVEVVSEDVPYYGDLNRFAELREACVRVFDNEPYGLKFARMIQRRAYMTMGPG